MPAPKGWNPHATARGGNLKRGERHEQRVAAKYRRNGWKVTRAGWGSDFQATRGRKKVWVECKTGTGRLTEKQERKRRAVGDDRYRVYRHGRRV